MVGEYTSIACHEKSGAKEVKQQRRSCSLYSERHHPLFIHQGLTCGIRANTNYLSRVFIPKFHDHVQQADARTVGVNNRFSNPALVLQLVQALLSFLKLLFERFAICVGVRCDLFTNILGLPLQCLATSPPLTSIPSPARLFS